ncbi:hypothetical protein KIN20_014888 [Parelaphostrongylus tenuis]|uniref:Uncharacterized protein n=1 Tax=Parelaphostrongylus tenuis TaxID=148309 RepID=A0AAD5MXU0_PARTN|nr:hypothetical protein KIN20_014888 [Parelaphostrongylus tenuis]
MVAEGLVAQVTPLIENDAKALNLLYQLSVNDDAKAMLTFTDAMQLPFVMSDKCWTGACFVLQDSSVSQSRSV